MLQLLQDPFFLLVASLTAMVVAAILGEHWRWLRQLEIEADLKRDLAGRGYAPEDIERIIAASALSEPVATAVSAVSTRRCAVARGFPYNTRRFRLRDLDAFHHRN